MERENLILKIKRSMSLLNFIMMSILLIQMDLNFLQLLFVLTTGGILLLCLTLKDLFFLGTGLITQVIEKMKYHLGFYLFKMQETGLKKMHDFNFNKLKIKSNFVAHIGSWCNWQHVWFWSRRV